MKKIVATFLRGLCRAILSWLFLWTLVFLLLRILSPDPVTVVAGFYTDQVTRQFLETEFGLEGPFASYIDRLSKVLLLDFGTSWRSGRSAIDLLAEPIGLSLSLTAIATLASLAASLAAFLAMAITKKRVRLLGGMIAGLAVIASTLPGFVLALIIAHSRLPAILGFPAHGIERDAVAFSLLFPSMCIALPVASYSVLRMLACYRLISGSAWLRGSLAAGSSWREAVLLGGTPFAVAELLDIAFHATILSLTGAVAVESILGLPGLGIAMLDAIELQDHPVILAIVAFVGALTITLRGIRDIGQALLSRLEE